MTVEFPEAELGEGDNIQPQPQGLPHPGVPIMIVVTVDADGRGSSRYLCEPEQASAILHGIADDIRVQAARRREAEDLL